MIKCSINYDPSGFEERLFVHLSIINVLHCIVVLNFVLILLNV